MHVWDLFKIIKDTDHSDYHESGDHVNWLIKVDENEKKVYLLFEESNGKRDWLNNLAFPVKPYKKQENTLLVAHGWCNAYKSCNDEIQKAFISKLEEYNGFFPIIAGWSYGGAMAVLAAEDFYFRTKQRPNLITFGAPKPIFGKKSMNHIKESCGIIRQFANVNDCICNLPPFPGYKHINKIKVGNRKFNLIEWFKPKKYHTIYDEESIYVELNKEDKEI